MQLPRSNPGEQILLQRGGTWTGELTVGAPGITLGAYGEGVMPVIDADGDADGVTIDPATSTVRDLEVKNAASYLIKLRNCHRATVRYNTLHDSTRTGIIANVGGGDHTIENNSIYSCGGEAAAYGEGNGINFQPTTTGVNVVRFNDIHHCGDEAGDHGVYSEGGVNLIASNRFWDVSGFGVKCKAGSSGSSVLGNTMTLCRAGAVNVDNETTAQCKRRSTSDHNSAHNCGQYPSGLSPYVAFWVSGYGRARLVNNTSVGSSIGIQVDTNASLTESDYNDITTTGGFGNWKGTPRADPRPLAHR